MMDQRSAIRIVVADDCGPDVILIEETLRTAGLQVELTVFPDGEACAGYLKSNAPPPAAILLDLNLPRLDGFELLTLVRADPRYAGVPVAVLTSSRLAADKQKSLELGANAFITKPGTLDAFLDTVGSAIHELLGRKTAKTQHAR